MKTTLPLVIGFISILSQPLAAKGRRDHAPVDPSPEQNKVQIALLLDTSNSMNGFSKGIIINTIHCGNRDEGIAGSWHDGAALAGGKFMIIDQDRAVCHIPAPQDKKISDLGIELNKTYLGYGKLRQDSAAKQVANDHAAAENKAAGADVQRAVCKASANYSNASWDIVDAIRDKKLDVTTLPKDELPDSLRGLDAKELNARIEEAARQRAAIQSEIAALNKEREAFVAGETAWMNVPKDVEKVKSANPGYTRQDAQTKRYSPSYQQGFNEIEMANRAKNMESQDVAQAAISNALANTTLQQRNAAGGITGIGSMRPAWIDGELFLLRQITVANARVIQGVWLDAAKLRNLLLAEITDLLPAAKLEPLVGAATDPLVLVSFPFRLIRDEHADPPMPRWGGPLLVGWAAVFCALSAVALLLHGVMRLSERRASFVSAVTHELRTPLTTFRLYSDMLESGAVKEEKRGQYLRVLSREADRLSHLVENVLAFSRIERGSARSHVSETSIESFLESQRERWSARLATAGLELVVHPAPGLNLRTDLPALEHILFNLIDNAAKYAAASIPPQVEISARAVNGSLIIEVADHGPGIPAADRRRIFRPFHKSAREAADTQPGVGLGLALSLRLARELGGALALADNSNQGARFLLRLPRL